MTVCVAPVIPFPAWRVHPGRGSSGSLRSSVRVVRWCRVVRAGTDSPREVPRPAAGIHSGSLQHFSLLPGHLRVREACWCPVLKGTARQTPHISAGRARFLGPECRDLRHLVLKLLTCRRGNLSPDAFQGSRLSKSGPKPRLPFCNPYLAGFCENHMTLENKV